MEIKKEVLDELIKGYEKPECTAGALGAPAVVRRTVEHQTLIGQLVVELNTVWSDAYKRTWLGSPDAVSARKRGQSLR